MAISLIVNPGSSSKKYALYDGEVSCFEAYIEKTKSEVSVCISQGGVSHKCEKVTLEAYHESLADFLKRAVDASVISSSAAISVVGVRVVAPGTFFSKHALVTKEYRHALKRASARAPLHVPHTETELALLERELPNVPVIAISDSAFHATMPNVARNYSLPKAVTEAYDIHRFGYHGLSVAAVCTKLTHQNSVLPERLVVCHIGSGVSVTAVKAGRSVDTTMGYAPGSGLVMGSRAGDVDAGALLALMQERHLKPTDAECYLQTHGGLFGLSGQFDLRSLLNQRAQGDSAAILAIEHFVYHIAQAIARMSIPLRGIDTVVFTATAGERSPILRTLITEQLAGFGALLEETKNEQAVSKDGEISSPESRVQILVVKTDEAAVMVNVCQEFVSE